jgi:AraC-like DNA-binding protein
MNDYERIATVIRYLDQHHTEQPALADLARNIGLSPFHFHRLFSRWAGVTPKDFVQCLTIENVKRLLRAGESVLDTALQAGLSGPGRLHDLCVSLEAASPGELKNGGAGIAISYGFAATPFGSALIGETTRGICHLSFVNARNTSSARELFVSQWPKAQLHRNDANAERLAAEIFARRTKQPARTPSCICPGNTFSSPSLASSAPCAGWIPDDVQSDLRRDPSTNRSARGGHCGRCKSNRFYHPMSSGDSRDGSARRIPLGHGAKTGADWLGTGAVLLCGRLRFTRIQYQRGLTEAIYLCQPHILWARAYSAKISPTAYTAFDFSGDFK